MKLAIRIIISFVIVLGGFLLFIFTSNDKLDPIIKENCFIRGNMIGESQKEINDADRNGFVIKDKTLVAYVGTKKNIVIPSSVNRIQADALAWDTCHAVMAKKITIPGSVKTIDNHALAFVKADTIIFKEGVTYFKDFSFLDSYPHDVYFPSTAKNFPVGLMNPEEGILYGLTLHFTKDSKVGLKVAKEYKDLENVKIKFDNK